MRGAEMNENIEYSIGREAVGRQAGKAERYLTFRLKGEEYAVPILKVHEIIGQMEATYVPRTPEFVRGVINLRGKIIPVIDLKVRFGMQAASDTDRTCIIVLQIERSDRSPLTMGVLVDDVPEVLGIGVDSIGPAPEFGTNVDMSYLLGVGRINKRVIMLLDIDKILSGSEMKIVEESAVSAGDQN